MDLRRHNEIIAFKAENDSVTAFHAYNLEVAEISPESFAQMTPIEITNGVIPDVKLPVNPVETEAFDALNEWNTEVNLKAKSGKIDFGIRAITINVNQICNLKCLYCAAGGDGTYGQPANKISIEKTLPQLKFFLERLQPGQKFKITFIGGEPLLHPEAVHAIYSYMMEQTSIRKLTPAMSIVTNGTLLTGKTLEIVRSMKIDLIVSIDGPKEINDIVRPTKNNTSSTDLTLLGLKNLADDRGEVLSIGLSAVCSEQNPDMISTYHFFQTLKPDWMEFNFGYTEKSLALQKNYIEQMNQIAATTWALGGEKELRKIKQFDTNFRILDQQLRLENHCGAGKSYLMVDAKNKLYTCPWVVGDKDEVVGENEQLDHAKLANYSKSLIELNNCQTCWARHLCGGGCMFIHKAHTGDKHKKDILFCERTRSLLLTSLLYYKLSRTAV
ncbi:radical SAM/SPASM domain-containing protein [Bdellovibrio sp. qaytius]|nr:radical SAM/SPASM domain-containing protein [Bdellovibrio sp. qaytius]